MTVEVQYLTKGYQKKITQLIRPLHHVLEEKMKNALCSAYYLAIDFSLHTLPPQEAPSSTLFFPSLPPHRWGSAMHSYRIQ